MASHLAMIMITTTILLTGKPGVVDSIQGFKLYAGPRELYELLLLPFSDGID